MAERVSRVTLCVARQTFDWHNYITPAVALVSALVALGALLSARALARQKATIDLIEKVESTQHYRDINAAFSAVRRSADGFAKAAGDTPEAIALRKQINDYLNHYELIALGIRRKVLDGAFYRAWMGGAFVRDWNAACDWIEQERWRQQPDGSWSYRKAIFQHYEHVACRWSKEAIRLSRRERQPPIAHVPEALGDEPLPHLDAEDPAAT